MRARSKLAGLAAAGLLVACGRTELDAFPGGVGVGGSGQPAAHMPMANGGATNSSGELCGGRTTNHHSGSRLLAAQFVTAQGVRAWDRWWDSQRREACDFVHVAGGGVRCAPRSSSDSKMVYADAACTTPLYTRALDRDCAELNYITTYTGGCGDAAGISYHEPGRQVDVTQVFTLPDGGACQPTKKPDTPLFELGADISPTQFVAAESRALEDEHRVRGYGYLAADGTQQVRNWLDAQLDSAECYFDDDEKGQRRCLPIARTLDDVSAFSDPSCSSPLIFAEAACGSVSSPAYGYQRVDRSCWAGARRIFARKESYSGPQYGSGGGVCQPFDATNSTQAFKTQLMPPESFAPINRAQRGKKADRLQPRYDTSQDGGCWFYDFWDTALDVPCWFGRAADGEWRCLPSQELTIADGFEDAACEKPAWIGWDNCLPDPAPAYVSEPVEGECAAKTRVFRNQGQAAALGHRTLFHRTETGCSPMQTLSTELWLIPAEPTELEHATLGTEGDAR